MVTVMFNVSQHIIGEAKELLGQKAPLPQQITSATSFYVAEASDHSVLAFARLVFEEKTTKSVL
jgi:hypothetical protein